MPRMKLLPAAFLSAACLLAPGLARAEVSVTSSRETAVLTAASVKIGGSEVLVLIDRSTHIMRVYSFRGIELLEMDGSPVALGREFNPPTGTGKSAVPVQGYAPAEYLIVPVNNGNSSLLCVLNSQTRKLLVCQVNGQKLSHGKPVDLKKEFELKN